MEKINIRARDKFWLFASKAHDDDAYLPAKPGTVYGSRITPAEGAFMLGVPNLIMIGSDGRPVPYSSESYGYMESFCRLKKVLWSVTGSGAFRIGNEEKFICHLAEKYPNISGAFLDDMFGWDENGENEEKYRNQLFDIRKKIDEACRPMELWSTCYIKDVEKYSPEMYAPIDVITIWNMNCDEIVHMERDFHKYEVLLPNKRKMLGLYLYDYTHQRPVSNELMKIQCETGLKWLREGRIEGMIFLTNCTMGVGFSSEYWLRSWIDEVGDEIL